MTARPVPPAGLEGSAGTAWVPQGGSGPGAEAGVAAADAYDVVIEGDGFLYKMVRIVAGTLLMVGMGLAPPETVLTALAADGDGGVEAPHGGGPLEGGGVPKSELRRRGVVGPTLPPERLCLEHVEYDREHGEE